LDFIAVDLSVYVGITVVDLRVYKKRSSAARISVATVEGIKMRL